MNTATLTVPNNQSATVYLGNTTDGANNWQFKDFTVEINPYLQADDWYVVPGVFSEPSFSLPPKSMEEVLKLMDEPLEKLVPKEIPLPQKERGRLIERDDEE
jgi:hypothetical protein